MIVNRSNIDNISNNISTIQDTDLVFSNDLDVNQIVNVIQQILFKESVEKKSKFNIQLQKEITEFDTEKLTDLYKWLIDINRVQTISNDSLILNIMSIIKSYNTFSEEYFNDPRIFFSSIEQFLDVKISLQNEIQDLMNLISTYFISLFRSLSKIEYTALDSYVDIPEFFKVVFLSNDLVTLSGILAAVPADYKYKLKFLKNAHLFINHLIGDYSNASIFMKDFLEKRIK